MPVRPPRLPLLSSLAVALAVLAPAAATGQERTDTAGGRAAAPPARDTVLVPPPPVSPTGAFVRALAVPGWGHAALGSYTRGGFYFATESAAAWMLARISERIDAAEAARRLREREAEARIRASGVTDPDSVSFLVEEDPEVQEAQGLVEARDQQFEDWLAVGIFLVLLGGADAYVSAHLYAFPEPVDVRARPLPGGGMEVGVSIPVGPGGPPEPRR